MFADIILPLNLPGTFTYKVPLDLQKSISTGMRVLVPFRGKKIYTGIVDSLHANKPQNFLAKDLISILDKEAILPKSQLDFWHWIADYYLGNLGEIYRYTFPSSLKLESETYLKLKPYATINLEILDSNELLIVQALEVKQLINLTEIEAFIPKKEIINTIHSLLDLQYIEVDEKVQEKYKAKEVKYIRLVENILQNNKLQDILLLLKNAPKQQQLFLTIVQNYTENPDTPLRKSTLLSDNLFTTSQLKALQNRNLVEEFILEEDRLHFYNGELDAIETLSPAQEKISKEIDTAFLKNQSVLLHGVTASGKTHLYLKQIENTIASHKSVLFLLPEIAITKQIANRLEKKYGSLLGFYHQKLSDFEKVEVWRKIKKGEIKIIIGTKEALFLPFDQLGLIIVDEEHDLAYRKKDFSPFFNAKDSALVLAKLYNCPCILGSATPSVESYYWAMKGKLKYLYLNVRYGNVSLPSFELINIKEEIEQKKMQGNFSNDLLLHLQNNFQEKKQALILHNRRGYSMVVECESCGYVQYCSNCDVVMTYHKSSNEMKCHYCGQKASKPQFCPKCHSQNLNDRGVGVEQIQEELNKLLPETTIDRMDVDAMRRKFAYEQLYEKIEQQETDIIVGTQMISKGLDFDLIEIVSIPKADSLLYMQDYRAEERAYQLIIQVAGRAGRKSGKGKVYIQTFQPQHKVFQLIKENNPDLLYQYFLVERKKFNYPPFVKTIFIELRHRKEDKVERASRFLSSVLQKYLPEQCILGPEKSSIAKMNTLYQYQILLKLPIGKNYALYKSQVRASFQEFDEITAYQSIKKRMIVDF